MMGSKEIIIIKLIIMTIGGMLVIWVVHVALVLVIVEITSAPCINSIGDKTCLS